MVDKKKSLSKEELVEILRGTQEEGIKPSAVRELFDDDGEMTLKTETPPRMVNTLVRMKILEAAADPDRNESLISVFIKEYDKRMVSLNRKGRLELLGALQAFAESERGEELPLR